MTFAVPLLLVALQVAAAEPKAVASTAPPDRVEIVLYSDFQCPFCAQLAPAVREIQAKGIDGDHRL
jgi:protein-disulfide isomerase